MLVEFELERNAKVRAVVEGYVELTEAEKTVFRLAVGISKIPRTATERVGRPSN